MGKNSRARHAAKRKTQQRGAGRARGARPGGQDPGPFGTAGFRGVGDAPPPSPLEKVNALWGRVLNAEDVTAPPTRAAIERLSAMPERLVDAVAQDVLVRLADTLWKAGWQPAELRRHVRRTGGSTQARLAEIAILADHARRSGQGLDPRWAEQLAGFGQRDATTQDGWFADWRRREAVDRTASYAAVAALRHELARLPRLDVLIPPPGAPDAAAGLGAPLRSGTGHPMLERIRKLLAKAEATEFEEEAATLTAKAQELMTRHAIDEALLAGPSGETGPRMVRLPIDPPYADAKSVLLAVVAGANRGRSIYIQGLELGSVVAHVDDLATIELMFTSLLVQAQRALAEAGRGRVGSRTRSPSFRSSFLVSYANRIGERLVGTNDEVVAGAEAAALPVLRRREHAVEEFVDEHYGGLLTSGSVRGGWDPLGRAQGREAADRARLDAGELAG